MYNFSSEGAYFDFDGDFWLIGPTPDEIKLPDPIIATKNIQAQIKLDQLSWLADCIDLVGCPKCSVKQ